MIGVIKPAAMPAKLEQKGAIKDKKNRLSYNRNPQSYKDGLKKMDIDSNIFNHPSVKKSLKKSQHNKCCFCEKIQSDEYGAVEHYRPKNGFQSIKKDKLTKPGYYWLGYSWSNLYFVCTPCNTVKGNLFPLTDERKRATSHKNDIKLESPLLLDPSGPENPRDHIVFDFEFPRGKTDFGKKTIEICGLDRASLNEMRKQLIDDIKICIEIVQSKAHIEDSIVELANNYIANCQKPNAMFSAAATDYISRFNIQSV